MKRTYRRPESLQQEEVLTWGGIQLEQININHQARAKKIKRAIDLYASGTAVTSIEEMCGISRDVLYEAIRRARTKGADGTPMGWAAIIKGVHRPIERANNPEKTKGRRSKSGAFQALLKEHPDIAKSLRTMATQGKLPGDSRSQMLPWSLQLKFFHTLCEGSGIKAPNYPFTSNSEGEVALKRWVKSERERERRAAARARELARELIEAVKGSTAVPWSCVQMDGHFIDQKLTIELSTRGNTSILRIPCDRVWIIALLDTSSTAALGYSIAFGENYASSDVIRAVRSALIPWTRRELSTPGLSYADGDALPSGYSDELTYICFDEFHFDGAASHTSHMTMGFLERFVGCTSVQGPIAEPDSRPDIEQFFNILEEGGFHWLKSTTGSSPQDPRRQADDRYLMPLPMLMDAVDIYMARYNNSRPAGSSLTRNEILLRRARDSNQILRKVDERIRESLGKYDVFAAATIREKDGRRVIRHHGDYVGSALSSRAGLLDQGVILALDSQDVAEGEVILASTGESLGLVKRQGPHRVGKTYMEVKESKRQTPNRSFQRNSSDIHLALHLALEENTRKYERSSAATTKEEETRNQLGTAPTGGSVDPTPKQVSPPRAAKQTKEDARKRANPEFKDFLKRIGVGK
ncbi:hypothetical protein [Roseateles sp.]|uniref:hypothetical protein n=1 Tax=Roseateles sp. TaxID=1971397 RepID=UPI0031D7477D